jgi:hypothetical protein
VKNDLGLFDQTEYLLFLTKQELALSLFSGCYIDPRLTGETEISVPISVGLDPMNVYEGVFPTVLLEKISPDSNFGYPIGVRISPQETITPTLAQVGKLQHQLIPFESFESIVFKSVEDEIDFKETCGQFIITNNARAIKRVVDPAPFVGFPTDIPSPKLDLGEMDEDPQRFEDLERCASAILAVSSARRKSAVGGQVLIDLIPGRKRPDCLKHFGPILTALIDHRRGTTSSTADTVGSIFQAWANVFLMVPEEAINSRDILKTCIEATKSVQISKTVLAEITEAMSFIDDYLSSKSAFTPFGIKAPRSELDSLIASLTLALMRPATEELLDWDYQEHMASEPEFIAAAYLTGLLLPRRKHKKLRDEVVETVLISNQISSMKRGFHHLDVSNDISIEVKPNDVLSVKIDGRVISKPYGSSWNIKKNAEQDASLPTTVKPRDNERVRKQVLRGQMSNYEIEITDGILTVWARTVKKAD